MAREESDFLWAYSSHGTTVNICIMSLHRSKRRARVMRGLSVRNERIRRPIKRECKSAYASRNISTRVFEVCARCGAAAVWRTGGCFRLSLYFHVGPPPPSDRPSANPSLLRSSQHRRTVLHCTPKTAPAAADWERPSRVSSWTMKCCLCSDLLPWAGPH